MGKKDFVYERHWKYLLSAIVIIGAMLLNNGWWVLILFLIWS